MPNASRDLVEKAVNTIRMLAADAVQQANSGHPGMPMGAADMAFVLWTRHLRFDPTEPRWIGRDRFVLSAGHGSMLLYSLLHLAGFDCTLDDLKQLPPARLAHPGPPRVRPPARRRGDERPARPGLRERRRHGARPGDARRRSSGPGSPVDDHFVYAIVSDGDLMEGVAAEAASFAGHNRLGRLVYLYDDNEITIDGRTSHRLHRRGRHEALRGLRLARAVGRRPRPRGDRPRHRGRQGGDPPPLARPRAHHHRLRLPGQGGQVLGARRAARRGRAQGDEAEPRLARGAALPRARRRARLLGARCSAEKAEQARRWTRAREKRLARGEPRAGRAPRRPRRALGARSGSLERLLEGADGADATRKLSAATIQKVAPLVPSLVGGSADLAESNLTDIKGGGRVLAGRPGGRATSTTASASTPWARIANGLAYDGLFIPFIGTFLQFADYMRPAVRLAALARLQTIYVWTHDSIFLGEDGPTHQPVEHLTALRAIPNLHVVRPCRRRWRSRSAWAHALARRDGPTALVLTRQKIAPVRARRRRSTPEAALRGGYVVGGARGRALHPRRDRLGGRRSRRRRSSCSRRRGSRAGSSRCRASSASRRSPRRARDAGRPAGAAGRGGRGGARARVVAARRARTGSSSGSTASARARRRRRSPRSTASRPAKVAERIERWLARADGAGAPGRRPRDRRARALRGAARSPSREGARSSGRRGLAGDDRGAVPCCGCAGRDRARLDPLALGEHLERQRRGATRGARPSPARRACGRCACGGRGSSRARRRRRPRSPCTRSPGRCGAPPRAPRA